MSVSGTGQWSSLKITVNQTADLTDQAVSVTWSGGQPTFSGAPGSGFSGLYSGDYLQMFECWSSDANTQPQPEQCEFGGENKNGGAYPVNALSHAYERVISAPGWSCGPGTPSHCMTFAQAQALASSTNGTQAYLDPNSGWVLDPFQAADGTLVEASVNYGCCNSLPYSSFDTNPYFNYTTTNELDFSRTFNDTGDTGQDLFTVATGLKAPGLGCGETVTRQDGSTITPACWLVIVPRGTPVQENETGDSNDNPQGGLVDTSPLSPTAWPNHIAIPLQFEPVSASCPIGNVRRIVGSELAAPAAASWQPTLCQTAGNPPYSYAAIGDDSARSQLLGGTSGATGMAVVSDPIDPSDVDPTNPVVYAPLTLSGAVIGFNIERVPATPNDVPVADEVPLKGTHVTQIQLTPRLVAKLLTESYRGQIYGLSLHNPGAEAWAVSNPIGLLEDPDFLQFNPEFTELKDLDAVDTSTFVVEEQSSDAAALIWQWIMADKEASAWLNGAPDPWGMVVNPYYSTNAAGNPGGVAFGQPSIDNFPKADPYTYTDPTPIGTLGQPARPLSMQDWSPYVNTMHDGAAATRAANSGADLTLNLGANNTSTAWQANGPQEIGQDFVLSITDTVDAARYGLQAASLSRAGDDSATRAFVAPNQAGLLAGEQAMQSGPVSGVVEPDPSTTAAGAYPLTLLTYAAIEPVGLDQSARQDYASFISYAINAGQTPGYAFGTLPPGYVSLPSALVTEATTAVATILNPPSPTTTTTSAAPTTTSAAPATTGSTPTSAPAATSTPTSAPATTVAPSETPTATTPPVVPAASPSAALPNQSAAAPTTRATTSPGAGPGPVALPASPTVSIPIVALARSPRTPVGAIRYAVPLLVALGLMAAAGAYRIIRRGRDIGV